MSGKNWEFDLLANDQEYYDWYFSKESMDRREREAWNREREQKARATPNVDAFCVAIFFGGLPSGIICYAIFLATSITPAGWLALTVGLLITALLFCLIKYCETPAQQAPLTTLRP